MYLATLQDPDCTVAALGGYSISITMDWIIRNSLWSRQLGNLIGAWAKNGGS